MALCVSLDTKRVCVCEWACEWAVFFLCGSRALFTEPASMDFNKFFFKTESHDTIHTFKNYFTTVFSIFNNK